MKTLFQHCHSVAIVEMMKCQRGLNVLDSTMQVCCVALLQQSWLNFAFLSGLKPFLLLFKSRFLGVSHENPFCRPVIPGRR